MGEKRQRGGGAVAVEMHLSLSSQCLRLGQCATSGGLSAWTPISRVRPGHSFCYDCLGTLPSYQVSYYETHVYLFIYWGWRWCWHMSHRMCVVRGQPARVSPFLPLCEFQGLNLLSHLTSSQVYSCNQMYLYFLIYLSTFLRQGHAVYPQMAYYSSCR